MNIFMQIFDGIEHFSEQSMLEAEMILIDFYSLLLTPQKPRINSKRLAGAIPRAEQVKPSTNHRNQTLTYMYACLNHLVPLSRLIYLRKSAVSK